MKRSRLCCLIAIGCLWSASAAGQGFGPRPGPGMGQERKPDTPAGPAEAAPEEKEGEPELPALPAWPGQETRKLQLFQMNGYFRFRWNLYHNMNLGLMGPGAPFHSPISESSNSNLSCAERVTTPVPGGGSRDLEASDCPASTLGGADIRLRLEPTINVSSNIRIRSQFDVFDNLELGSTPRGQSGTQSAADVPIPLFSDGQATPIAGRNTNTPAIVAKRAWAEVGTPIGELRFGRMAAHWGMGLLDNDGSCENCDRGDSIDRIMFATNLSGHTFAMGYDFASSGPNSMSVSGSQVYYSRQPIDLEKLDDVNELFWVAGRFDPEEVIQDKVEQGQPVLNYGLYLLWRRQDFDYNGNTVGLDSSDSSFAANMVERHGWMLTPDLWFKLLWKNLTIEFEGVLIGGVIENAGTTDAPFRTDILEYGWALRSQYRFLKDTLKVGLEIGMASGDQAEAANGEVDRNRLNPLSFDRDGWLREFRFDYDYQIDLILFREILGTVANAVYFKPSIQYNIVESLGARLDMIYSLAHQPVAFPGNARNLGLEFDLNIFYRNVEEGFYAGLLYGLLIPFDALDRPASIYSNSGNAEVAHTLQGRLMVKF